MPQNADPFPNWLLQLLGANVLEETDVHDEPHFYCQGDGIGVHPSIVEVDIEEDLSSSESSSSNDDAAENTISENEINQFFDDMPFEDIPDHDENQNAMEPLPTIVVNNSILYNNEIDSTEEFFDTIDDPIPMHSNTRVDVPNTINNAKENPKDEMEPNNTSNNQEPSTSSKISDTIIKESKPNLKEKHSSSSNTKNSEDNQQI